MKRFRKKLSALLVTAAMAATMIVPASAANTYPGGVIPGNCNSLVFNKYLVLDADAHVPNVDFTYTLANGTSGSIGGTSVLAGVGADDVKFGGSKVSTSNPIVVSFTSDDDENKLETVATGDPVTLESGKNYVKKSIALDFSDVSYTQPGIYAYSLVENNPSLAGISYDSNLDKDLYVYVVDNSNDTSNTLKVAGFALVNHGDVPNEQNKVIGYVNEYDTNDVTLSKTVAGNQGSRDQYFTFSVTLAGAGKNALITVDISNADESIDANPNSSTTGITSAVTNVDSLTANENGEATGTFYLQHGQQIVFKELAAGTTVTVVESQNDGYTVTHTGSIDTTGNSATATINNSDIEIAYTNTKEGTIPTGVLLTVVPVAIVGLVVVAGIAFFAVRGAKRKSIEAAEAEADSEE